jgi:2,4-didehydro-3-deoxy-L-rhamnonate hydrolase
MRLCRFRNASLGVVESDGIRDVTRVLEALPPSNYPFPCFDLLIANMESIRRAISSFPDDGRRLPIGSVEMLSPVGNPGKLIAAPVNYQAHLEEAIADKKTFSRAHVQEIQKTGLFLKATSSLIGASGPIVIAHPERRTDHEVELAVIIGKEGRNISSDDALNYVAGYSIGLDITIRGPEERSLRKSLDSYSVLGPWIVTADEFGDPAGHDLLLTVGEQARQRANTRDLIMSVPALIEFASRYYTLYPGDVLYTGTPEGVGPIVPGDTVYAEISGIGGFSIEVVRAGEPSAHPHERL